MTAFLLDEASRDAIKAGLADFSFMYECDSCYVEWAATPEAALAYDRESFAGMIGAAGLTIVHSDPGSWRGSGGVSYQDVLILSLLPGQRATE